MYEHPIHPLERQILIAERVGPVRASARRTARLLAAARRRLGSLRRAPGPMRSRNAPDPA